MTNEPGQSPICPGNIGCHATHRLEQNLAGHGSEPDETHQRLRLWWRNLPDQQRAALLRQHDQTCRGKAIAKDAAIDERLNEIGIASVRVPGKAIAKDLKAAADLVSNALASMGGSN